MDGAGNASMRLFDDPMSVMAVDCPYPPSVGSSIYPGQACYAGINAFNDAVVAGKKPGDPDFPIPACPGSGAIQESDSGGFPGDTRLSSDDSGGFPQLDLDTKTINCGTLTLQYMPDESLTSCFPIIQITQDSPFSTITAPPGAPFTMPPGVPVYYDSKSACETACKLPPGTSLLTALTKDASFCGNVPSCSTTTRQTSSMGGRPSIVGEYSCFQMGNGGASYSVLPKKDNVGCSVLYNNLPVSPPPR